MIEYKGELKDGLKKDNKIVLYLLFATLALLWGLSFLGTKVALVDLNPVEVLSIRWAMGLVVFIVLILIGAIKVNYKDKPIKYLIPVVAIQPCTYSLLEAWGIDMTTSSESSIIIAVVPLMVAIEARIFLKQKINRTTLIAICVAFTGIIICIAFSPSFSAAGKITGYLVLFCAVSIGAAYTLVINKVSAYFTTMEITFALELAGGVFFTLLSFIQGNGLHPYRVFMSGGSTTIALIYLGLGCSCAAYIIFNYNLSRLPAIITTSIQTNSITLIGVVAGIIFGGDPWGFYTILGLALTVTGIFISTKEIQD